MRFATAALGFVLGIALGLLAGWVVWPVEFADVTPEFLSAEAQNDYAIMIAASYNTHGDLDLARARFARLGNNGSVVLLNAMSAAEGDPALFASLQELAADLGLYATMPDPPE